MSDRVSVLEKQVEMLAKNLTKTLDLVQILAEKIVEMQKVINQNLINNK